MFYKQFLLQASADIKQCLCYLRAGSLEDSQAHLGMEIFTEFVNGTEGAEGQAPARSPNSEDCDILLMAGLAIEHAPAQSGSGEMSPSAILAHANCTKQK